LMPVDRSRITLYGS